MCPTFRALAVTALITQLLTQPANAGGAIPKSMQIISTAFRLSNWAEQHQDATAMLVAAQMLDEVSVRPDAERSDDTSHTTILSKESLLDRARVLAQGDRNLLTQIELTAGSASKGVVGGPIEVHSDELRPGSARSIWLVAEPREELRIFLIRDGYSYPAVELYDLSGKLVFRDNKFTDLVHYSVLPELTTTYQLRIRNTGPTISRFAWRTN